MLPFRGPSPLVFKKCDRTRPASKAHDQFVQCASPRDLFRNEAILEAGTCAEFVIILWRDVATAIDCITALRMLTSGNLPARAQYLSGGAAAHYKVLLNLFHSAVLSHFARSIWSLFPGRPEGLRVLSCLPHSPKHRPCAAHPPRGTLQLTHILHTVHLVKL